VWDRLFGTYTPVTITGERKMCMGLEDYRAPCLQTLENMLLLPFNLKRLKMRKKARSLRLKVEDHLPN
jgi:hypothetical protein